MFISQFYKPIEELKNNILRLLIAKHLFVRRDELSKIISFYVPHNLLYSTWLVPGMPIAEVNSVTATTISLSWSVPSGSVDSYMVTWERNTSGDCPVENRGNRTFTNGYSSYTIEELEENSNYTITLTAINAAGSAVSDSVTRLTRETGEG